MPDVTPTREPDGLDAIHYPPVHAIGEVTLKDGSHRGWILSTDEAVVGTITYANGNQVMLTLTHGTIAQLGDAHDIRRGALIALLPVVQDRP